LGGETPPELAGEDACATGAVCGCAREASAMQEVMVVLIVVPSSLA
jgi:hypothetical protein